MKYRDFIAVFQFIHDVLDALFNIFMHNSDSELYDNLVFDALVSYIVQQYFVLRLYSYLIYKLFDTCVLTNMFWTYFLY